jgi:ribosome modulation factor
MKNDAYWEGYIAAENGKSRDCINPWNAQWTVDWLRGYDDASELMKISRVVRTLFKW